MPCYSGSDLDIYELTEDFADLTPDDRQRLIEACDDRLTAYIEKRGLAPWQHCKKSAGYARSPLSLRQVEDLLHERGIDICHETVRFWRDRFGPMFAAEIRKRRVHSQPVT